MEARMSWIEQSLQEGIRQGIEQGMQLGRQEGMLSLVIHLLERRLGSIDDSVRSKINGLSPAQLEGLRGAPLDFSNAKDLTKWLQVH